MSRLMVQQGLTVSGSGLAAASQAEQEAGSSNTVATTPGTQHFHPSACKFWAELSTTGTLNVSYNVTSRTDNGAGDETITIATDFSSANWAAFVFAGLSTFLNATIYANGISSKAAGSVRGISTRNTDNTNGADPAAAWGFCGFGDL